MKMIGMLKRKPGTSLEEFIKYYETIHAPLATRLMPLGDYRRNYIITRRVNGQEVPAGDDNDFDVITEVWFRDQDHYEAFAKIMRDPAVRGQIVEDEERFMDRSKSKMFVVDERSLDKH
jgi:uncharacterized protein (TIGR02118 family)